MALSSLRVEVLTSFTRLWALGPEWQALESACGTDLPFQTWEWVTGWWSHLHDERLGVRDSLRVCVIRQQTGELVGIAPLMITERPSRGPLRLRVLQFIGADPNITELRSMLCLPAREDACYSAILEHLAASSGDWDWMAWEGLPRSPAGRADPVVGLGQVQEKSAFVLDLAPTWDEFKATRGRNIKQSLRKCYNSLKRDGLTYSLKVIEEPREIDLALAEFFTLHAARAHLNTTVHHGDVFSEPRNREFLVEVCERLAKRGKARVFQLYVDDTLVATRLGFLMGDTLYLYYSGWDPQYGQYSVMTTLLAEVLQYAIAQGLKHVNLSTGTDVSKTRWGARETRFVSGRQLSPSRRVRTFGFLFEAAIRIQRSSIARMVTPAFLVRGAPGAPPSECPPNLSLALGLTSLFPAIVVLATLDLLDGRLDGRVNLAAFVLARHLA